MVLISVFVAVHRDSLLYDGITMHAIPLFTERKKHPVMRTSRWLGAVIVPFVLLVSACSGSSATTPASVPTTTLNVFAAASLTDAFTTIGNQFTKAHPAIKVVFNFAGSQQLAQQIMQGAPADVFASANNTQMQVVIKGGQVTSGTEQVFARNRLVVITPKANPANIQTLQDLAKPGLKLVLADAAVPVGQYARDFLKKASGDPTFGTTYSDQVLKNVVSNEQDVKVVYSKVQLGEADAGIVYTTDAAVNGGTAVNQIAIPDMLNVIAMYPIAPISASTHHTQADQFIAYVRSSDGQAVLSKDGFISAP